jgi:drug/metabolite transporter (DMT)-like permease
MLANGACPPILLAPMPAPGAARFVPHALMVAMIAIWGGSYAAVKVSLGSLSPFAVIAVRFWIAVACLLPFLRSQVRTDLRATRGPGLAAGGVLVLGYLMQTIGMTGTSSSMGGFLAGLIVPLVAIGGFLLFGARFGKNAIAGVLLALAGITMLCWPNPAAATGPTQGPTDTPLGIALQLGSSLSYAIHILIVSRYGRGAPTAAFCLWQLLSVAIASTIAALLHGQLPADGLTAVDWTPKLVGNLLYLGLFATALGIGVQSLVQHKVPSTHLALLFALQPLFAALVGWATLGDQLATLQLLGGGVIVAGVVVTSLDR